MNVLQSGLVVPGHAVSWASDNVVEDAGAMPSYERVLGRLLNADFNSTADQAISIDPNVTAFAIIAILITNSIASLNTAVGGFYPSAGKAGTPLVLASQVYSFITGPTVNFYATLTSAARFTRWTHTNLPDWSIYLSLTTGQPISAFADVYVLGLDIST